MGATITNATTPVQNPQPKAQLQRTETTQEPRGDGVELSPAAQLQTPAERTWKKADDKVELSPEQEQKLDEIGAEFKERTGLTMRVVSGKRTPEKTADQLVKDMDAGKADQLYEGKQEYAELKELYQSTDDPARRKELVTERLRQQEQEGRFLSNHQTSDSVDISTSARTEEEIKILREIAESKGMRTKDEGDHIHMDMPGAKVPTTPDNPNDISPEEKSVRDWNSSWLGRAKNYLWGERS